jgi:hypothetical protein
LKCKPTHPLSLNFNLGITVDDTPWLGSNPKTHRKTVEDKDPEGVAWLMSFLNSGTSYTIEAVRELTNTTVATNYGKEIKNEESVPAFPDTEEANNGPFLLINDDRARTNQKLFLTKTHCAGYCSACLKPNRVSRAALV